MIKCISFIFERTFQNKIFFILVRRDGATQGMSPMPPSRCRRTARIYQAQSRRLQRLCPAGELLNGPNYGEL